MNSPYPYDTCTVSPGPAPPQPSDRAVHSAQFSKSVRVYPTTVGFPVVPELAWMRTISSRPTPSIPNGYCSRKSCFVMNGNLAMSSMPRMSSGRTPAASIRSR